MYTNPWMELTGTRAVGVLERVADQHFVMWHELTGADLPPGEWRCRCGLKFGFSMWALRHLAHEQADALVEADLLVTFDLLAAELLSDLERLAEDDKALLAMEVAETTFLDAGGGLVADKHRLILAMLAAHVRERVTGGADD